MTTPDPRGTDRKPEMQPALGPVEIAIFILVTLLCVSLAPYALDVSQWLKGLLS